MSCIILLKDKLKGIVMQLEVHKFGGTSLADAKCINHVAEIFENLNKQEKRIVFVLSAVSGVTNSLIEILQLASQQNDLYKKKLDNVIQQHQDIITQLIVDSSTNQNLIQQLNNDKEDLKDIFRSVYLGRSFSKLNLELVSGYGEQWSTLILSELLKVKHQNIQRIDAREVLVVEHLPTGPSVDWDQTQNNAHRLIETNDALIITGYVASTKDGIPTTLNRNGSDYSASIFGALLDASSIHIWTDVDGIMTADPNKVRDSKLLQSLSFKEALELSYFGSKVLHPNTMVPAIKKGIPLWIRSTFNQNNPGTKIDGHVSSTGHKGIVKAFASINDISVINLEGAGMIGVPGISERLFGSLRQSGISVIMISQASSEYSISIAVKKDEGTKAQEIIENEFSKELTESHIKGVKIIPDCCILAAIGDGMVHHQGVSGHFFGALARAQVSIRMIAQGSSERNISIIIDQKDLNKALNIAHSAFYLSHQTLSVGIVGVGLIGSTLMKQLEEQKRVLKDQFDIDLRVRALANSQKMLLEEPCTLEKNRLLELGVKLDWDKFCGHIQANHIPHSVIIDCTASSTISKFYPEWLSRGIHLITPNKKANSESFDLYQEIKKIIGQNGNTQDLKNNIQYFYETTVGAGLPIISTLKDLIKTGDKVTKIEGVFSGTLSYIFNEYSSGMNFSHIVTQAKEKGYTEPDPREDLSGLDVARKAIILAREIGMNVGIEDIPIESLVPKELSSSSLSIEEFLEGLKDYDTQMQARMEKAIQKDSVLRFVGTVDIEKGLSVGLREFKKDHAFAQLKGSENIVQFTTNRYQSSPLIVRGPGAGAEVTAAGVFADLLRLSDLLRGSF